MHVLALNLKKKTGKFLFGALMNLDYNKTVCALCTVELGNQLLHSPILMQLQLRLLSQENIGVA